MSFEEKPNWALFYDGSLKLQFLADALHMPVDQLNFVVSQLTALLLAFILRTKLPALSYTGNVSETEEKARTTQRHSFALVSGMLLTYFCFGRQILLPVILCLVCYTLVLWAPVSLVHKLTLAVCMTLLSAVHVYRMFTQGTLFVIDITGPLMCIVQRASSFAFALNDGLSKTPDQMTKMQANNAVRERPSIIEYCSYVLSFQSVLAGPFIMFKDYHEFISGSDQFAKAIVLQKSIEQTQKLKDDEKSIEPCLDSTPDLDSTSVAFRKLGLGLLFAASAVLVAPYYPVHFLTSSEFSNYSFINKVMYMVLSTTIARHIYYAAWLMAESACNMGGLGYSGTEESTKEHKGRHLWKGASNVDIMGVEFGSSLRVILDSWNGTTAYWLRYSAYERLSKKWQVIGTYALSSLWHGFYPGYFCTFLLGACGTYASRMARRFFRPIVLSLQGSEGSVIMSMYHVLTWFIGRLILAYGVFSFVLLKLQPILAVYSGVYFYVHVGCVAVIALTPSVKREKEASSSKTK